MPAPQLAQVCIEIPSFVNGRLRRIKKIVKPQVVVTSGQPHSMSTSLNHNGASRATLIIACKALRLHYCMQIPTPRIIACKSLRPALLHARPYTSPNYS
ncbi:hypothetical protein VNO77_21700 [Canavalia gladiata]|uniref:Uncharacterized protein n=1 Tax=Canavalia gladiata TaxID=3824 RepID=A0AAN9L246_CANGL